MRYSLFKRFIEAHLQLPLEMRLNLLYAYIEKFHLSGRIIVNPSSVVYIPPKRAPILVSKYKDSVYMREIPRYVKKLRKFPWDMMPAYNPTQYKWGIWFSEVPKVEDEWVEVDIRRAYPRTLYIVGAISSDDWKRAWLSKKISNAIVFSLGMLQSKRIEIVFENGRIVEQKVLSSDAYNRVAGYFFSRTDDANHFASARYVDAFLIRRSDLHIFQKTLEDMGYFSTEKGRLIKVQNEPYMLKLYIQETSGRYKVWSYSKIKL